ncbi:uncharacterized protein METZ01_LOCUS511141, partial [marine metagenome]
MVDTVVTTGGTLNSLYWNSTNTGLELMVGIANDLSLIDGYVQLRGRVNDGDYENVGSEESILNGFLNDTITFSLTASEVENMTGFGEDVVIDFSAIIADKAGNQWNGTPGNETDLIVDQTAPADGGIEALTSLGGNILNGYFNSTNTGLLISVNISKTDTSLAGGSAQMQMKTVGDFATIDTAFVIELTDVDAGFVDVQIDADSIKAWSDYLDGRTIFFRSILTDVAG